MCQLFSSKCFGLQEKLELIVWDYSLAVYVLDLLVFEIFGYFFKGFVLRFWHQKSNKDESRKTHHGVEQKYSAQTERGWKQNRKKLILFAFKRDSLTFKQLKTTKKYLLSKIKRRNPGKTPNLENDEVLIKQKKSIID